MSIFLRICFFQKFYRLKESILIFRVINEQFGEIRCKGDLQFMGDLRMEFYLKGVIYVGWKLNDLNRCFFVKSFIF